MKKQIAVNLSISEYEEIYKAALERKLYSSTYIRSIVMKDIRSRKEAVIWHQPFSVEGIEGAVRV